MGFGKKSRLDHALGGIDILRDVHLVLAPLRPTDEMINAGAMAAGINPVAARLVYESMVRESVSDFCEDIY